MNHQDAQLGAALAYYSIFSLGAPLMVIAIAIAGSGEAVRGEVGSQLKGLLGDAGAQATQLEEPYRQALAAKDSST